MTFRTHSRASGPVGSKPGTSQPKLSGFLYAVGRAHPVEPLNGLDLESVQIGVLKRTGVLVSIAQCSCLCIIRNLQSCPS